MKDTIIAIAVVVVVAVGFWWTRGAGGFPGGVNDPARQDLTGRFDQFGGSMPSFSEEREEREDREHEIE